ncbi:hypothetical protein BH11GEM1_BH11GEM1_31660 [soil metagenome]
MKIVWTELAEYRALEAVDYITRDRPEGAADWLEELLRRVARLDRLAKRGRVIPEIGLPAYREVFHAPYRVLYRVDAKLVVILTLRHWRRAWDPSEVADGA